ncbi:MAG: aminotransferase class I/II-fold pyridoxal phosphate-dependent enzyme [Deltaproteobacteria bacterium]|nr:aminotransferase class I/II-fold pyridoxal phosphate-dependent enzyme [Deltaproteobacteria bacterium]
MTNKKILLSTPHMGSRERELLLDAFDSGWIVPLGPHVDAFEREMAEYIGVGHAAALSSGTAALHLALVILGVEPGDEVWTSSLTFSATCNAIHYTGAEPVLVDSEAQSWNMDPDLLAEALADAAKDGKLPKAIIPVDLYGQCADYGRIEALCAEYEVALVEDAAEALGATCCDRKAGSFGRIGALSFNGNKMITSGGGGMLISDDAAIVERARFLATQARDPAPHYQHSTIGYNYRLSNILAAIGRGQLTHIEDRVKARRRHFDHYAEGLSDLPGVTFMPEAPWGQANRWLTCLTIDPSHFGADREAVRNYLGDNNIEARPVWKPMHLQPVFSACRRIGGDVSERLFQDGLCLPSGSSLTEDEIARVIETFRATPR